MESQKTNKYERLRSEIEKVKEKQRELKDKEKQLVAKLKQEERSEILGLVEKHHLTLAQLQYFIKGEENDEEENTPSI